MLAILNKSSFILTLIIVLQEAKLLLHVFPVSACFAVHGAPVTRAAWYLLFLDAGSDFQCLLLKETGTTLTHTKKLFSFWFYLHRTG